VLLAISEGSWFETLLKSFYREHVQVLSMVLIGKAVLSFETSWETIIRCISHRGLEIPLPIGIGLKKY